MRLVVSHAMTSNNLNNNNIVVYFVNLVILFNYLLYCYSDFTTSMECLKAVSILECLKQDRQFSDCVVAIDMALKMIKGPQSSMKTGEQFIIKLAKCLYTDNFIYRMDPV